MDAVEAVAVLHGAGTACLGLFRDASIAPAETVVIGGGAGAVGGAAVQLAARAGARVLATAAPQHADWCRANGAQQVFDYRDPVLIDKLRDAGGVESSSSPDQGARGGMPGGRSRGRLPRP